MPILTARRLKGLHKWVPSSPVPDRRNQTWPSKSVRAICWNDGLVESIHKHVTVGFKNYSLNISTFMAFSAALALEAIDNQFARVLDLHRFDLGTRTKTRLFSIGGPQGKQFALIIGDLDPVTKRPMSKQTVVVLPIGSVPSIDGVMATGKPYKTQRLRQTDSKLCAPDNRGYLVADEAALNKLLRWYASA